MRQQQCLASSLPTDPTAVHRPPDQVFNFNTVYSEQKNDTAAKRKPTGIHNNYLNVATSKKAKHLLQITTIVALKLGANIVGNAILLHQLHCIKLQMKVCKYVGRKLLMKFNVNGKIEWFKGIVNAYDGLTGKLI